MKDLNLLVNINSVQLIPVGLEWEWFCSHEDTWSCLGTFLIVTIGGRYCWYPVSRAAKAPAMYGAASTRDAGAGTFEKPWDRQTAASKYQIYIIRVWGISRSTNDFRFPTYSFLSSMTSGSWQTPSVEDKVPSMCFPLLCFFQRGTAQFSPKEVAKLMLALKILTLDCFPRSIS